MADPLLEIRDLSVRIGREQILHRVGIQVARGSCHCIVGPNGAGKSTLLAAILGTLPFAGEIRLHWRSQRGIGFVPQRAPLDVSLPLTAQEFLALSRARRPVFWGLGFALRERVLALLKEAELEDIRHTPLAQLSGGELARLLFVNATDPLPELLLLDEPTSGLDAASRQRFEAEIRALRQFIESGAIGKPTTANCDFFIGAHFGGFRDRMAHVLLLDMAIHTFDQARLITGSNPVSVYCHEWNPVGSWYDHDASAVAIFEMTGGIVFTYRGSWCSEGRNTEWESDWRIIGENGSVTWDGGTQFEAEKVKTAGGFRSEMETLTMPPAGKELRTGSHEGNIREFVDCVLSGGQPETTGTDNVHSLAMVFGAIESATSGRKVAIE